MLIKLLNVRGTFPCFTVAQAEANAERSKFDQKPQFNMTCIVDPVEHKEPLELFDKEKKKLFKARKIPVAQIARSCLTDGAAKCDNEGEVRPEWDGKLALNMKAWLDNPPKYYAADGRAITADEMAETAKSGDYFDVLIELELDKRKNLRANWVGCRFAEEGEAIGNARPDYSSQVDAAFGADGEDAFAAA